MGTSDSGIPLSNFWTVLQKMAEIVPANKGAERALWDRWPFVAERWKALLAQGVKQNAIKYALIGVQEMLIDRARKFVIREEEASDDKKSRKGKGKGRNYGRFDMHHEND